MLGSAASQWIAHSDEPTKTTWLRRYSAAETNDTCGSAFATDSDRSLTAAPVDAAAVITDFKPNSCSLRTEHNRGRIISSRGNGSCLYRFNSLPILDNRQ